MNIYVSNLPLSVTEDELKQLFVPYGTVESLFLEKDKHSGIVKGTAYVIMPSEVEAEQAIAGLDGTEYNGQELLVVQAEDSDFPAGRFW